MQSRQKNFYVISTALVIGTKGILLLRVQDCQGFNQYFSGYSDYILAFVELIEEQFDCAGVCEASPYYLFTNVNNGTPGQACAPKIQDYWDNYSKKIGAAAIVVSAMLLLISICSCCMCCHPDKNRRVDQNGYQRF